jgi:ABC-type transport system substrate-binding protein
VGTTHYRVTSFEPGGDVTIVRDDHEYWQTDASLIKSREQQDTIDELLYKGYAEASQQSIAAETGDVDLFVDMSGSVVSRFESDSDYTVYSVEKTMSRGLYFSGESTSPLADNLALRQAICYAIDVDGVITMAMQGRAVREKSFTSSATVGYNQKWLDEDWYEYDVDKAKEKLAEAGYAEGELTLTFVTVSSDEWQKIAQVIQNYLQAIGINVEIEAYDSAYFGTIMNDGTQYDLTVDQIGGNFYAVNVNSKLGQSGYGGKTKTGFVDDKLESLITACRYDSATEADYDALHNYIRDTAYVLPLYDSVVANVWKVDSGIKSLVYDYKMMNVPNATVFE